MSPVVDDVLEVRDLHVDIRSRRSVVHAVDGASFDVAARTRRWASSASRGAARA